MSHDSEVPVHGQHVQRMIYSLKKPMVKISNKVFVIDCVIVKIAASNIRLVLWKSQLITGVLCPQDSI